MNFELQLVFQRQAKPQAQAASRCNTTKLFIPLIGPHMVEHFNALESTTPFPTDSLKAHITVIPKEGKDPTCCGSYRPISLLNCDLNLFTKIIARHNTYNY